MAKKTFGFEGIIAKAKEHKSHLDQGIKGRIFIDPEFEALIPPLQGDELAQLAENIRAEGCREPLLVWPSEERYILVDGHNRYRICQEEGIDFKVVEKPFADRLAVQHWMILNQLGRRNLTPEQVAYFRGKRYENEKQQGKRTDLTSGQNVQKSTASKLAEELRVNEKTIRRDARFAVGLDVVGQNDAALKKAILAGQSSIPKHSIEKMADLGDRPAAEITAAIRALSKPTTTIPPKKSLPTPSPSQQLSHLQTVLYQQVESLLGNPSLEKMEQVKQTVQQLEAVLFSTPPAGQ